jgi:hypothetical protein
MMGFLLRVGLRNIALCVTKPFYQPCGQKEDLLKELEHAAHGKTHHAEREKQQPE